MEKRVGDMTMKERDITIKTLRAAQDEIRELRERNNILAAKVEVMDLFATVLNTKAFSPPTSAKMDAIWVLENHIRTLEEKNKDDDK